jgi:hypothetical protein
MNKNWLTNWFNGFVLYCIVLYCFVLFYFREEQQWDEAVHTDDSSVNDDDDEREQV